MSWMAGHINTKLIEHQFEGGDKGGLAPRPAVQGMIRDIGKEKKSYGHVKHFLGSHIMLKNLPIGCCGRKIHKKTEELFL